MRRFREIALLLAVLSAGCASAGPTSLPPGTARESLSGEWTGEDTSDQAGSCTLTLRGKQSHRSKNAVTLVLEVAPDGRLTGRRKLASGELQEPRWSGQVASDFQVQITRSFTATCGDRSVGGSSQLKGRFVTTPHGLEVRFGGEETWCPTENCKFVVAYVLTKR